MGTPKLNPHFLEFLKCFRENDVRYLLIGGFAVGFYGWVRNTKAIDFWIAGDDENQARAVKALRDFAFPAADDGLFRDESTIVRFGVPPYRIEILRRISGVRFEEAWANRATWEDGGVPIPVIGLAELRRNKAASGRAQDIADLENLPPA